MIPLNLLIFSHVERCQSQCTDKINTGHILLPLVVGCSGGKSAVRQKVTDDNGLLQLVQGTVVSEDQCLGGG